MSIIRIGLAETKNFSDGYDLIFGKKDGDKADEAKKDNKPKEEKQDSETSAR